MQDFTEMKREGLSVRVIGRLTGYDRKTVSKYLVKPETAPRCVGHAEGDVTLDA